MEYTKTIRIFEIKDNINLPTASNPNEMANCSLGDKIITFDEKSVYAKNRSDDNNNEYVLLSLNFEFVKINKHFFNEI
jgi:hypothetical protein